MTDISVGSASGEAPGRDGGRLVLYAVSRTLGGVDDHVLHALAAIRPLAAPLVVIVPGATGAPERERLAQSVDDVVSSPYEGFDSAWYRSTLDQLGGPGHADEVILTGDSWFGPINDFAPVLERMSSSQSSVWSMVENAAGEPESFPDAGFRAAIVPWGWVTVRRAVVDSDEWASFWNAPSSRRRGTDQEREFLTHLRSRGHEVEFAFPADRYPSLDPGLYTPALLLDDGCPLLRRDVFSRYPPFLDRYAVIGREILRKVEGLGFPLPIVMQNLVRTVPPKALYANAGLFEVLPDTAVSYDPARPFRIAVVVHVTEFGGLDELLSRLTFLPTEYDLFLTTTDGQRATELVRIIERRADSGIGSVDVRVTPASRGRDMSDFFVGCRDVLLGGNYDLIVKVHSRRTRRKTVNVRRYFRRYQYENLLGSSGYVANLLGLFQREPNLGFVFPPMMHIGYSTMGGGWGGLRETALELCERLGIHVPFDNVSPLAPYGGMWIGRPEALRLLSSVPWRYRDYAARGADRSSNLAGVQERLIAYAGAELGYHSRTVLTREHAAISHTAVESKVDYLFSTTRGWPVEQIQLLQRAGNAGHGGIVALSRMYIRVNHPRAAWVLMPFYELATRTFVALKLARGGSRRLTRMIRGLPSEGNDEKR